MKLYYRIGGLMGLSLVFSLLLAQAGMAAPQELSLEDSVALALKNNPKLKIAESGKEEGKWAVKQAEALKGVKLSYEFLHQRSDVNPLYPANLSQDEPYNFDHSQLTLTLPLYTGGKLEGVIEQAKLGEKIGELNLQAAKQQIKSEATLAYCNVLHARNMLDIARQTVADFSGHLKNVQEKYDAGVANLPDLLQTKVKLASAQDAFIKAQNAHQLAEYKLNNVMGLPLKNEILLKDRFAYQPYALTEEECIRIALGQRPELLGAQTNVEIKKDGVKVARSGELPTVGLFAAHLEDHTDHPAVPGPFSALFGDPGGKHEKWVAGVKVDFDIFDSGMTHAQIKKAEAGVVGAEEQAKKAKDDVALDVSAAYLSMKEAEKRLETNQVAIDQAETDLKLSKQRYDAEVGTNLDVMDAELALNQAKSNYSKALYDYHAAKAQLERAMGLDVK